MQYRYTAGNLYLVVATKIGADDSTASASANTAWKACDAAAASKATAASTDSATDEDQGRNFAANLQGDFQG